MTSAQLLLEEKAMGRIIVEIGLVNPRDRYLAEYGAIPTEEIRKIRIEATIDTGANHLVLPTSVAEFLGLHKTGEAMVRYGDGRTAQRETIDAVELELLGRTGTFRAMLEPARTTALVGAIVLEDLDLLVDCGKQQLYPRDPHRIIAEVE
jgi:predicted aspartyl protease